MTNPVLLGLVCWIATTIVVEAELTRPVRERVKRSRRCCALKLDYLVSCHLCSGTWIGLTLSAVFGSPWGGFAGIVAGGLLYKAIAHLILELRPQAWL